MNIDDLKPGRELDALVAEKVMGWTLHVEDRGPHMGEIAPDGKLRLWVDGPAVKWNFLHWKPSTDIAAAWEVLGYFMCLRVGPEKHPDAQSLPLKNSRHALYKPVVRLDFYEHDDIYRIEVGRCKGLGSDDDIVCETNRWEEVPLLICRAALKAVGA